MSAPNRKNISGTFRANHAPNKPGALKGGDYAQMRPIWARYLGHNPRTTLLGAPVHQSLNGEPSMARLTKAKRFEVLTRDGYRCRYCGVTAQDARLHIDHVLPIAHGGKDDISNLVAACADCNSGKSDRKIIGIPEGFALTEDKRPARFEKMKRALAATQTGEHILNCDEIEELDEINGDEQLAWIWCKTHGKLEWHSIPRDMVECGGIYRTSSKEVNW